VNDPARRRLAQWVRSHDRRPELPLDDDTPLFVARRLTSLDLPDLLVWLETERRATIDVGLITPDAFASIASVAERFLTAARADQPAAGPGDVT
jgi:hypothetical protein